MDDLVRKGADLTARNVLLLAVAVAVALTSVAAAGPAATKQRVAIELQILPELTFRLVPLRAGPLKRDLGTISTNAQSVSPRTVMRDGQKVTIFDGVIWTLEGKRGTLTIRDRNEWVNVGDGDGVGIGTWRVIRGTGQYAGVTGKGGNGHAGLGTPWYARYEGILTIP